MSLTFQEYQHVYNTVGSPDKVALLMYIADHSHVSPKMCAQDPEVKHTLGMVAHFFKSFRDAGLIVKVGEASGGARRGSVEKFYSLSDEGRKILGLVTASVAEQAA